jgi:hypothetical protein
VDNEQRALPDAGRVFAMSLTNEGIPFLASQASSLGIPAKHLPALVHDGQLRRVLQGIYVDPGVVDSRELRCLALSLVCPVHAVIWGSTAAWIWGVDAYEPERRSLLMPECVVPHHWSRQRRPGVRTVESKIAADDVTIVNGIRVTIPDRTAVDLLRFQRRPFALASVDAMARAELIDLSAIRKRIAQLAGHPGIRQARELVMMVDPARESHGESWTFLRLVDAGLPRPKPQIEVLDRYGKLVARIDMGYEAVRVGVEFDGRQFHTAEQDEAHDESRRERLRREFDWRLVTCDSASVMGAEPALEEEVAQLLGVDSLRPRGW